MQDVPGDVVLPVGRLRVEEALVTTVRSVTVDLDLTQLALPCPPRKRGVDAWPMLGHPGGQGCHLGTGLRPPSEASVWLAA